IILLANLLSFVTENISLNAGPAIAGLLNATFSNVTELIISIFALHAKEIKIVQSSMLGSIISNILLVLGTCFLAGGIKYKIQKFNQTAAQTSLSLMTLACISLIIPATFNISFSNDNKETLEQFLIQDKKQAEVPQLSLISSIIFLIIITGLISLSSEFLVNSFEKVHVTAVIVARKDKINIAINIAIGSSMFRNSLTVQIEYYVKGIYGTKKKNPLYEALSWIISQQTKKLDNGSFIVQPANNKKYEIYEIPDFIILPEKKQQISIEYRGRKFNVIYKLQENNKNNNQNYPRPQLYYKESDSVSSIFLSIINDGPSLNNRLDVNTITEFISEVTNLNSLETVVLDEPKEELLKKELDSFINDKEFYKRINLYYLNFKKIKNDNDMSTAFSSVLSNQIIVLEDVDTQSNILFKRGDLFLFISLSNFLGYLDGQILSEGTIIIITTNHIEKLDPACIRPSHMDVHLDLGYCTHYQIRKMYQNITNMNFSEDILEQISELLLPPCD
ncbi:13326_t:CDS:2, partial [Racocetra persica]